MIIEGIFNLIKTFLGVVLTPFEIIPNVPSAISTYVDRFFLILDEGIQVVAFFMPAGLIKVAIPVFILIINMEKLWSAIMWILKKLPFVGIE